MAWDQNAFENAMIDDMRAHEGTVTSGPLAGHPLLDHDLDGAKSGEPRRAILTYTQDSGDYVVAGTAGGSPTTPAWVHNVDVNHDVTIEVGNRSGRPRRPSWPTAPSATGSGTSTSRRCRTSRTTRSRRAASSR